MLHPHRHLAGLARAIPLTLLIAAGACGVSRSHLVEERPADQAGPYIEAIARVARARGYEVRTQEDRVAKFVFDEASRGVLTYQVKRNGIVMVVTLGEDEAPQAELDAAFAQGEALGRELMDEARGVAVEIVAEQEREARLRAERERREAAEEEERDRQRAAERQQRQAELAAFMADNQSRARANSVGNDEPEPGRSGGEESGASAHCCVNGAFYDCPSAAAVDQCVGRFTRCISGCGMGCMEQCLQSDPPDPSSCDREPSRDGEC